MSRTIVSSIQQRFSDIDSFLHVNNVAQQMYFDVGKTEFYEQLLGSEALFGNQRVVTVSTQTSYMEQVRMGTNIRVTTCCEKVGNKSMTLFQQLYADDRLCTESRSVMVAFDFVRQESVVVPDAWRQVLEE